MRRPNTIGSEWAPILKRSNVCMQRALRGCIAKGPGWRKPAGLANHRTHDVGAWLSTGPHVRLLLVGPSANTHWVLIQLHNMEARFIVTLAQEPLCNQPP